MHCFLIHYNNTLAGTGKRDMVFKKGELLIDGGPFVPPIAWPSTEEVAFPCNPRQVAEVMLNRGNDQCKGKCLFIGYSCEVKELQG